MQTQNKPKCSENQNLDYCKVKESPVLGRKKHRDTVSQTEREGGGYGIQL